MMATAQAVVEAVVYVVAMLFFVVFLVCLSLRGRNAGDDEEPKR